MKPDTRRVQLVLLRALVSRLRHSLICSTPQCKIVSEKERAAYHKAEYAQNAIRAVASRVEEAEQIRWKDTKGRERYQVFLIIGPPGVWLQGYTKSGTPASVSLLCQELGTPRAHLALSKSNRRTLLEYARSRWPLKEQELPQPQELMGMAPDLTGDLSTEEFVRRMRGA